MAGMFDELIERRTLYAACERVRNNGGCRGADGMSVEDLDPYREEEIDRIQDRLLRRVYHPFPLLRIAIPKPTSGMRHLSIPTVRDRIVQTAVDLVTREIFEREFEDCSHAYRCGRSVRTAIHRIAELRNKGYRWVVDADIDAFFDNIPHERLLARLRRLPIDSYIISLFEKWVRVEVYDGQRVFPLTRGIPQGNSKVRFVYGNDGWDVVSQSHRTAQGNSKRAEERPAPAAYPEHMPGEC